LSPTLDHHAYPFRSLDRVRVGLREGDGNVGIRSPVRAIAPPDFWKRLSGLGMEKRTGTGHLGPDPTSIANPPGSGRRVKTSRPPVPVRGTAGTRSTAPSGDLQRGRRSSVVDRSTSATHVHAGVFRPRHDGDDLA